MPAVPSLLDEPGRRLTFTDKFWHAQDAVFKKKKRAIAPGEMLSKKGSFEDVASELRRTAVRYGDTLLLCCLLRHGLLSGRTAPTKRAGSSRSGKYRFAAKIITSNSPRPAVANRRETAGRRSNLEPTIALLTLGLRQAAPSRKHKQSNTEAIGRAVAQGRSRLEYSTKLRTFTARARRRRVNTQGILHHHAYEPGQSGRRTQSRDDRTASAGQRKSKDQRKWAPSAQPGGKTPSTRSSDGSAQPKAGCAATIASRGTSPLPLADGPSAVRHAASGFRQVASRWIRKREGKKAKVVPPLGGHRRGSVSRESVGTASLGTKRHLFFVRTVAYFRGHILATGNSERRKTANALSCLEREQRAGSSAILQPRILLIHI
uniref:Uncharacterized protein n=1 Tax=Trichuris muris TaxID=70415 RepID=A0A5S6QDZ2_TRIMR